MGVAQRKMDQHLTEHQALILLTVAEEGSIKGAAEKLGVHSQTLKTQLGNVLAITGSKTSLQAYHRLVKGVRVITTTEHRMEVEE